MGSIPRVGFDQLPSAVPRGRADVGADAGVAMISSVSGAVGAVAGVAARSELAEAERQRAAEESVQEISNEVTSTKAAGEHEVWAQTRVEQLEQQYVNDSDKVQGIFREEAQARTDAVLKQASNSNEALLTARKIGSVNEREYRRVFDWRLDRRVQKTKIDVDDISRGVVEKAGRQTTPHEFTRFLADEKEKIWASFQGVHAAPDVEWAKLGKASALDYFAQKTQSAPASAAVDLNSKEFAGVFTGPERNNIVTWVEQGIKGMQTYRDGELLKEALLTGNRIADAVQRGSREPGLGASILTAKETLKIQRAAVKTKSRIDYDALVSLGIRLKGPDDKDAMEIFDQAEQRLDALYRINLANTPYAATDDVETGSALVIRQDAALKSKAGKDTVLLLKQKTDLDVAVADGKMRAGTAGPLQKTIDLALDKAMSNEKSWHVGWDALVLNFQTPHEKMVWTLKHRNEFKTATPEQQLAARVQATRLFNAAMTAGTAIDSEQFALQALEYAIEKPIKGVKP